MAMLPAPSYMTNAARTQSEYKVGLESWRNVSAETLGATVQTAITIDVSDQITPVVGVQSYSVIVNTGSLDNLGKIVPTNIRDGFVILLRAADPAKPITVKHRVGGVNQISLLGDQDYVLDDDDKTIMLQWDDTNDVWEEVAPGSMRAELFRMPGFNATVDATIASDILTVTQFNSQVVPQAPGADNLQRIITSGKGLNLVYLRLKTSTDSITIKNFTGSVGYIYMRDGADCVLNKLHQGILFEMRGLDAYEIQRFGFDSYMGSPDICNMRMSLSSTDPLAEGAGSSLYIHPYNGNSVSLKDTTLGQWFERPIPSVITKAIPATIRRLYNVYLYWTGSAVDVEFDPWDASATTGTITGASAAASCVITATNTLAVGDYVIIEGITGTIGTDSNFGINGKMHLVTAVTGANFTLGNVLTTGLAWTSGGTFYKVPMTEATGKVRDSGVLVKSGNASRRWIGLLMTNATSGNSNVTSTSGLALVANIYNTKSFSLVCSATTSSSYNGGNRPFGFQTKPRIMCLNPIAGLKPMPLQMAGSQTNSNNAIGTIFAYHNWFGTGASSYLGNWPPCSFGVFSTGVETLSECTESVGNVMPAGCNFIQLFHSTAGGANAVNFTQEYMTLKFPWG